MLVVLKSLERNVPSVRKVRSLIVHWKYDAAGPAVVVADHAIGLNSLIIVSVQGRPASSSTQRGKISLGKSMIEGNSGCRVGR